MSDAPFCSRSRRTRHSLGFRTTNQGTVKVRTTITGIHQKASDSEWEGRLPVSEGVKGSRLQQPGSQGHCGAVLVLGLPKVGSKMFKRKNKRNRVTEGFKKTANNGKQWVCGYIYVVSFYIITSGFTVPDFSTRQNTQGTSTLAGSSCQPSVLELKLRLEHDSSPTTLLLTTVHAPFKTRFRHAPGKVVSPTPDKKRRRAIFRNRVVCIPPQDAHQ